jgi:hypothetical protein
MAMIFFEHFTEGLSQQCVSTTRIGTGMGDLDPYPDANHGYFQTPQTAVLNLQFDGLFMVHLYSHRK